MSIRKDEVQINVEINGGQARKVFKDLHDRSKEVTKEMNALQKAFDRVADAEDDLKKVNTVLQKMAASGEENTAKYQELQKEQARLNKIVDEGQGAVKRYKEEFPKLSREFQKLSQNALEAGKAQGVSFNQLAQRQRFLQRAIKSSSNTKEIETLQRELDDLNPKIQEWARRMKGVSQSMNAARTEASRLPKPLQKILVGATALAAPLAALFAVDKIIDFGKSLFNSGVQMDVLARKAQTVLGPELDKVTESAEAHATAMGLTTQQYIDATAAAADLLIPMGFQRSEAASISTEVVNLSGALSEWTGGQLSAEQVSKSLNKALLGEREELKQLGISISEADVKTRLATKGLDKLTGQTLQQAKAAVTLELITEKSADAQAAFAQNTDSAVRKQAELTAKLNELAGRLSRVLFPVFERLLDFANDVADAVIGGAAATGRFSGAINAIIVVFKALVAPIQLVYQLYYALYTEVFIPLAAFIFRNVVRAFQAISDGISNFIARAKDLPAIGAIIKILVVQFKLWRDAIEDAGATFAGLRAAAEQAFENIKSYFSNLITSAQIAAKELNLAFSIRPETKDRLKAEIAALKDLKKSASESGKTIGEAYAEARNAAIAEAQATQAEADQEQAVIAALKVAETKEIIERQAIEKQKDLLNLRLTEVKNAYEREKLIQEAKFLQDEIDETEYHQRLHDATIGFYEDQLTAFVKYGQAGTAEAIKAQNELLKLQEIQDSHNITIPDLLPQPNAAPVTSTGEDSEAKIETDTERELSILNNKFARMILAEEEYELQRLEVLRAAAERRLELAQLSGEADANMIRDLETQKLNIQKEIDQKRTEAKERQAAIERNIEQQKLQLAGDMLQAGIEFLSADEQARKKHAGAIKSFETGRIVINLASEISNLFKNYSALPFVGQALAAVQAGIATIRAFSAIRNIQAQKFYEGGKVQAITGRRVTDSPNIPTQSGGDNILAMLTRGEVVLNQQQQLALGGDPVFAKIGVPGFTDGGLVGNLTTVNTEPRGAFISDFTTTPSGNNNEGVAMLDTMRQMLTAMQQFPTKLQANVVYEDFVEKNTEIKNAEASAAL